MDDFQFRFNVQEGYGSLLFKLVILLFLAVLLGCSKQNFSGKSQTARALTCEGANCGGRWLTEPWGNCSRACGGGDQSRQVKCVDGEDNELDRSECAGQEPSSYQVCQMQACPIGTADYQWVTSEWGQCSKPCDIGEQGRTATCVNRNGEPVSDIFCKESKPDTEQMCNTFSCETPAVDKQFATTVEPGDNKADILIVVDNSGSMEADNMKLAQRLDGFVNDMANSGIDWQMCITTTDMEVINGRPVIWIGTNTHIMNQQTNNKNKVFTDTIEAIGSGYSSDEQGIAAMTTVVLENNETDCFRDNAAASVILISDENERSVGGNQNWSNVQYEPLQTINMPSNFISTVAQTFGPDKKIVVNSIIVIPGDTTCEAEQDAQGSPSFFGTLYKELSDLTGGYVGSICANDYSQNLEIVKEKIQNTLATIELECAPLDTPTVTLNPSFNTNLMLDGKNLNFDPVLPENTQVTVDYRCTAP